MLAGAWELPGSKGLSGKDLSIGVCYSMAVRNQRDGPVKREVVIAYQMGCSQKREIRMDKYFI